MAVWGPCMKTLACLLAILMAFGAESAIARPAHHPRAIALRPTIHVRGARRTRRRSTRVLYVSRASDLGLTPAANGDVDASPDGAHFIKDKSRAGWGWQGSRSETVLGVYKRPDDPSLPPPDMYQAGKGAAGVSMSIKLGH